jgi:starch synthase (maltosyl-transferring)
LGELNMGNYSRIRVKDLVTTYEYDWYSEWNYVQLHPNLPFHIFKLIK